MATFYNQATLTYNGGSVISNVTSGEIVEVLSVTKTPVVSEYTADGDVTYAVSIVNTGVTEFSGLTITDDLGQYTFGTLTLTPLDYVENSVKYYINGTLQPTPAVTVGPPLTVTGITVPGGGNALILYTARTNNSAPPIGTGSVTNTASVTGDSVNISDSATITASLSPELSIIKSVSPTTVVENGTVTYTFVLRNSGNTEAVADDNVSLTDTFDPILSDISVTYNGTLLAEGVNYTYDEATGVFATVPGQITIPAATFTQDPVSGIWTVAPGESVLTVTGTI
ncbi:MAG: hypothetical protein IJO81_05645 [Clostridia bacterium]|nr:hypothetical protein [Clostridia bacterium]